MVNDSFNPNDIEFYTLKEGKYYQIRIKTTNRIINYASDLCDDQIEYTYKICVSSSTKEEINDKRDISKIHKRIAKLTEEEN